MKNIVVIGSSGHARVIVDLIRKINEYNVVGFIDDLREPGELTLGIPVIGSESDLPNLINQYDIKGCIVAVGDNYTRKKIVDEIKKIAPSLKFFTAIHPSAILSEYVSIGQGSVVMAGAVVNSSVTIGEFCIINTRASVDHDCILSDFVSLAPNVALGGFCTIGKLSAVGIGSNLVHNVEIGENCVIGAGALVLSNIEDNVVSYGVPAKKIKSRNLGEKYL